MASIRKSSFRGSKVTLFAIILIIFCLSFPAKIFEVLLNLSVLSGDVPAVADGFVINSYKVILNVNENNVVYVTEEIVIDWYETGHHGIYKFTPEWYEYTPSNGKTVKRKSQLNNYVAVGETYVVDTVKKKPRIKIGNANFTLPLGLKQYTITYEYDMGKDPFKNLDAFIFHAFGDYWGTPINKASIEIHMPSNFDSNKISFWADKYRKSDITSKVDFHVVNNVIYADVMRDYHLAKSLTIDIELPEGYFSGASSNYGYFSLILCLSIIGIAILNFFKWLKHGKDLDKIAQPVEFYPPENYDAAQIGYIYGKQSSKKLTIALIVQLASKGYIQINETADKLSRTIVNLCPKHIDKSDISNYFKTERRTIVVAKLKEADDLLNKDQQIWMKYLFRNGDTKHVITAFDNFFERSQELIAGNYIKIESDITDNKVENEEVPTIKQTKSLPKLSEAEQIVYDTLFRNSDVNDISLDTGFYTIFEKIEKCLEKELKNKVIDSGSRKHKYNAFIWLAVEIAAFYLAWGVIEDLNPTFSFFYTLAFGALLVTTLLAFIMGRKTEYGELITARVLGFRNYIEKAEKHQIDKMVLENPNYFFDILPYAYAMNVSRKWIENFENIPIPVSMGNFDYTNTLAYNDLSSSIHYPSSSGSSSGSSCGGGCSSCGGGCSSCGGGGSW